MTVQLQAIKAAINESDADWTAGRNFLTAMADEERRRYLGYVPGPEEPSLAERESIALAHAGAMQTADADQEYRAPASFDLRNVAGKNYITPVKNQGNCGSCVAFGAVAAVEGSISRTNDQPNPSIDLSEAQLFYCHARSVGRNCGNGWWVPPALDFFKNSGVSDEACYPYTAGDQNCSNLCSDWKNRAVKVSAWKELSAPAGMKEWLSTRGPLVACLTVYDDFYAYKTGVYRHVTGDMVGGHCVTCVGYDDAAGCWICKNSWGTSWGDKGYFRIAYGNVGIDARMWAVEVQKTDTQPTWLEKKLITGLWVINEEHNAAAYVDGVGWRKIAADNDSSFLAMVSALASAKASKSRVNLRIEKEVIKELYVF